MANYEEAVDYYKSFKANKDNLSDIHTKGYQFFVITKENFVLFYKNKDVKGYLDFYEKHNVIPVNQALTPEHALRRAHLYREIGCPPNAFKNSKVLEVGPGTGDNAVITSEFGPKEFWLIDGNSASCTELNKKIETLETTVKDLVHQRKVSVG